MKDITAFFSSLRLKCVLPFIMLATSIYVGELRSYAGTKSATMASPAASIRTVRDYGAKGDGIADDTRAIQEAITANAGKGLSFGQGFIYLISKPLILQSGSIYFGQSRIIAKEGVGLVNNAVLEASSGDHIIVRDLIIDCNGDNNGIGNGVAFVSGRFNIVQGLSIMNSLNTGIRIESEKGTMVLDNTLENCGRKGYSDNHGIMIFTVTNRPVADIEVRGNKISRAYRKGITTYSGGGLVRNIRIGSNTIRQCGLAGVYIGGTISPIQLKITIKDNIISECYQNIAVYKTDAAMITGNVLRKSTGGDGMNLSGITNAEISGNHIEESAATGLNVIHTAGASANLQIKSNRIINSNRSRSGYAPGINLSALSRSIISDNDIFDTGEQPLTTFGIYEQPGSDGNTLRNNTVGAMKVGKIVSGKPSSPSR